MQLQIDDLPYEFFIAIRLDSFLLKNLEKRGIGMEPFVMGELGTAEIQDIAKIFLDGSENAFLFESMPDMMLVEELYWSNIVFRDRNCYEIVIVTLTTPWATIRRWFRCREYTSDRRCSASDVESILSGPKKRAGSSGGEIKTELHAIPIIPSETAIRRIEQSDNIRMRKSLSERHTYEMLTSYLTHHNVANALFHAGIAYRYDRTASNANSLGYLYMASGDLEKARDFLQRAAAGHEREKDAALPNYNLGILEARVANLKNAIELFRIAERNIAAEKIECACLFLPQVSEQRDRLEFLELKDPELSDTVQNAISATEELLKAMGRKSRPRKKEKRAVNGDKGIQRGRP